MKGFQHSSSECGVTKYFLKKVEKHSGNISKHINIISIISTCISKKKIKFIHDWGHNQWCSVAIQYSGVTFGNHWETTIKLGLIACKVNNSPTILYTHSILLLRNIFCLVGFCFGGHSQQFLRLVPDSVLRNDSWQVWETIIDSGAQAQVTVTASPDLYLLAIASAPCLEILRLTMIFGTWEAYSYLYIQKVYSFWRFEHLYFLHIHIYLIEKYLFSQLISFILHNCHGHKE